MGKISLTEHPGSFFQRKHKCSLEKKRGGRSNFKLNIFFWYVYHFFHLRLIGLKASSSLKIESGFTGHHVYCLSMTSGTNWMPFTSEQKITDSFPPYVSASQTHPGIIKSSCVLSCSFRSLLFVFSFLCCYFCEMPTVRGVWRCRQRETQAAIWETSVKLIPLFNLANQIWLQ